MSLEREKGHGQNCFCHHCMVAIIIALEKRIKVLEMEL